MKGFANDFIDSGNGTQAALKNYDTVDPKVAGVIAVENLAKPRVREYIESKAEKAAEVVFNLSQGAENETVKLNASKDILGRAGFKPVEKSQSVSVELKGEVKDLTKHEELRLKYEEELRNNLLQWL